ncbi:LuxR family transcriptional regulator [Nonomuraea antimicrobica]|uniref:LuxR family transcriptional regulator n=1 Tax=Nonomuraea antimicrobica TaxID=561173 RepID=A0ABP7BZW0_9ACTN
MVNELDAGATGAAPRLLTSPVLVGREAELDTVVAAMLAPPVVVAVEGEAGVGKTRLVTELLGHRDVAESRRLVGRCHPIRELFPLGPLVEAVRGLRDELDGARLGAVAGALRPLLPELADVLPPMPEPLDDRGAERHRVFRGLIEVLACLGPTVLVVEDLHWADEQTCDFIAYLVSQLPPRLALVVTHRVEEPTVPAVRALTARVPAGVRRERVRLGLLDRERTGDMVAAILDGQTVSADFAGYLWERTSGLPLAVEEVLALIRARGMLVRHGGRWERKALDTLEVPTGIRDPTLERVARLPDAAQRLVQAAAVVQVPVVPDVLADGAAVDESATEDALGSGLLVEHDGLIGFRHQLAAQAVYHDMSGPRRRELHGRVAHALRALVPVPLGQVAHHLKQAGRFDDWAHAAELAADHAVGLANEVEAVRLLEDVLRTAALDPVRRGRLAVKLGRAVEETLRAGDVVDLLTAALDGELPRQLRGELRLWLAIALNRCGDDPPRQLRLLAGAVDDLVDRADLRARAMVGLGVMSPLTVPLAEDLKWFGRAVRLVTEFDDPQLETFVLGKVGMSLVVYGDPAWRGLADRVMERVGGAARQRREVAALWSIGASACWAGHLDIAERLLGKGLDAPMAQENRRLELALQASSVLLAYCRGQWEGLAAEIATLVDELSDSLTSEVGVDVQLVAGCLALAHGEVDDARRRLSEVLGAAERPVDFLLLPIAVAAFSRVALFRGDVEEAVDQVNRCLEVLAAKGVWAPTGRLLPSAVEVLVAAGEPAQAADLVDRVERQVRGLDAPLAPAAVRHARGVLTSSADEFLAAATLYEAARAPYEAAQAAERAARCLAEAGRLVEAGDPLRTSVTVYERLGATWDRGRAANLARQYGISLPSPQRGGRRPAYGSELSPRERDVAELASRGRTNKEIAAELFVSPNTVRKQLAAAMSKLGVHSRMALAVRLAASNRANGTDGP